MHGAEVVDGWFAFAGPDPVDDVEGGCSSESPDVFDLLWGAVVADAGFQVLGFHVHLAIGSWVMIAAASTTLL